MSETRRIWQCRTCKDKSAWREGWNWRLPSPPLSLDSFHAFCSEECAAPQADKERAA